MNTDRTTLPSSRRVLSAWMITLAATAASTYALDALATAAGVLLVASQLLSGLDHPLVLVLLAATYVLWGVALPANLGANWSLLRLTGTSTNALSKAAFALTRQRGPRTQRVAAAAGYVATEIAKEAPYYAGAFGAAAVTDSVSTNDALIFLAGTNLGAAAYEYGLARLTRRLLRRRARRPVVGDRRFPCANVDEPDRRRVLAAGFSQRAQVRDLPAHEAQGYSSVLLADPRRHAPDPRRARGLRSGILLSGGRGL